MTWTITVHIAPLRRRRHLSNTAAIATNTTTDPVPANDTSTATATVNRSADLAVPKTASPDPATAGTDETYTVKVTNNGPSDNAGFTLTDAVPAGTTFVSATCPTAPRPPGP